MTPPAARYKAIGIQPGADKPHQAFGNCLNRMREWAKGIAAQHKVEVQIYEQTDNLVETIVPSAETSAEPTRTLYPAP